MVWEAYPQGPKANGFSRCVRVTIEQYRQDLKNNLFKLWNPILSWGAISTPVKADADTEGWGGKGSKSSVCRC